MEIDNSNINYIKIIPTQIKSNFIWDKVTIFFVNS